jgi:hypothetical protein
LIDDSNQKVEINCNIRWLPLLCQLQICRQKPTGAAGYLTVDRPLISDKIQGRLLSRFHVPLLLGLACTLALAHHPVCAVEIEAEKRGTFNFSRDYVPTAQTEADLPSENQNVLFFLPVL